MKTVFTTPSLVKSSKGWYLKFFYQGKEVRIKKGLNRIQDLDEREDEFMIVRAALIERLRDGWNPVLSKEQPEIALYSELSFLDALRLGLDSKKDIAKKTRLDYECAFRFFITAISECRFESLKAKDVRKVHIRLIMDKAQSLNGWSNASYIKYLSILSAIITETLDFEIMEFNPCSKMKRPPVDKESKMHRPPTPEEFKLIIEALKPRSSFFRYCDAVYQTLCREVELLRLQVWMVDMEKRVITLPAGITKSRKKSRVVPINEFMYAHFQQMGVATAPKDYFVFGSRRIPKKSLMHRVEWLVPAPYEIHRNRVTELWKEIVKDGLKIDVTLYAMKSAGVDSLLSAGVQLSAVSALAGHASTEMTANHYASVLEKMYRDEVVRNAKKFGSLE